VSERLLRKEVARERLQISRPTLERLIERGELPIVRIGRRSIRIRESAVDALIERGSERRGRP
jgi:excisionase family DNA binding protein